MPSGGHARSGPAPDPNALRRDRKDDKDWTPLPSEGYAGVVPEFPLSDVGASENVLWVKLWAKPQAAMWAQLGLDYQVAAYVRAFLESVREGASAGLKTAVLRMEAELGLSTVGMNALRWKIATDDLAERRAEVDTAPAPLSARDRMKALNA